MDVLQNGGFFIYAIAAVGFVVLVIAFERALTLYFRFRVNADALFQQVKKSAYENHWDETEENLEKKSFIPIARIFEAAVVKRNHSLDEIQLAMEAEAAYQIPRIQRRLQALTSLANVSTLLGLVGTVVGLIKSFSALGGTVAAGVNKGQALAAGVSESMITTAGGLVIAIPAILAHLILSGRAQKLIDEIDHFGLELKKIFVTLHQSGGQKIVFRPIGDASKFQQSTPTEIPNGKEVDQARRQQFTEETNAAKKLALAAEEVINEQTEFLEEEEVSKTNIDVKAQAHAQAARKD